MASPELTVQHDLFVQLAKLQNTLRFMAGEDLITNLGLERMAEAPTDSLRC